MALFINHNKRIFLRDKYVSDIKLEFNTNSNSPQILGSKMDNTFNNDIYLIFATE